MAEDRQTRFDELLDWLHRNGMRLLYSKPVNSSLTIECYSLNGRLVIIQESCHGPGKAKNWEFFIPLTESNSWEGTKEAFTRFIQETGNGQVQD